MRNRHALLWDIVVACIEYSLFREVAIARGGIITPILDLNKSWCYSMEHFMSTKSTLLCRIFRDSGHLWLRSPLVILLQWKSSCYRGMLPEWCILNPSVGLLCALHMNLQQTRCAADMARIWEAWPPGFVSYPHVNIPSAFQTTKGFSVGNMCSKEVYFYHSIRIQFSFWWGEGEFCFARNYCPSTPFCLLGEQL